LYTFQGEVVTSRLGGRRNSTSRAPSAMTNETSEEVETIQWKRGNMLGKGAYGTVLALSIGNNAKASSCYHFRFGVA
jgi:hypothetical protein